MGTPLVTIIIPVYNSELYLEKCIKSVLAQSYNNLQVILVNDGSTDNSLAECKKIDDDRVEVYSKANGGASSARNFGLKYRKGKYVLFVDSDDSLKNNAIEILVSTAENNNADCVYYEAENVTDNSDIKVKKNGLRQTVQYSISDGNALVDALLNNNNYHAVPFLYFTNSSLYDNGLSFEEGIMFEDELFSFKLLRMCKVVVPLKEVLYYRNVREGSVMTAHGKDEFRFKSISVVFDRLWEEYKNGNNDEVYKKYIARIALLWLGYYNCLPKQIKEQVAEKHTEIKNIILSNKGFGNYEAVVRCYGENLWLLYIAPNRIIKRIKRKLKNG